jgi:alpha-glucosidase
MGRKENIRFFTELGGKKLVDDIKAYEKVIGRYDKQFTVKKRSVTQWLFPGAVQQVSITNHGIRLRCQNGWLELYWITPDCLRVRLRVNDDNFTEPFSYALQKRELQMVPFEVLGHDSSSAQIEFRTNSLICRIDKHSARIRLETLEQQVVCMDKYGIQWRPDGAVRLSMAMQPDEASYGMGERALGLQLRGKRLSLWNADPSTGYHRGSDPLYFSIPFYLGLHEKSVYGVLYDNSSRGIADLGASKPDELTFESESGELCYYLFSGADVKQVLARYTDLTGRIPLPPLWSLGYHQSRFSYFPQESVLNLAKKFRLQGMPCDVIYLDIHYMDGFRSFTWDQQRFPEFKKMIDTLHEQGFKVIPIIDPAIKIDPAYGAYKSGVEWKIFLNYPNEKPAIGVVWPGAAHFPDFTNPAARAWWVQQMAALIKAGVDGVWNDMCEPSMFTQDGVITLPDYVVHNGDGQRGNHLENHNVYGMQMGRTSLEALQKHRPGLRPFNVIRSGYAGAQRYAASWTGDNGSDWDQLRLSIAMVLNMGLSGFAMAGSNIGGFFGDSTGELYTRWLQSACLMPFFRTHSNIDTHAQEPWAFGQPYEVINRLTIELRYKLLPYLYSVVAQAKEYGWPIVRPIFMAEPDNPNLRSIDDSYMLGDAIMVAPVLEAGAVRRSVYLPEGQWYDYWTNELFEGGRIINVPAPLERLPLFVRAGAVLPLWPEMNYVGEKAIETLAYRVYPGDFETVQYEDKGDGFEYENGDYRWIYITCGWDDSKLIINRRVAGRYEAPYKSMKLEVVGFDEEPMQVRVDRQGAPLWFYDDGLLELNIDTFQRIEIMRKPLPTDKTIMRRPW